MKRRTEAEIMKNWPENHELPLVTVLAICYCHEKYLRTALDGILAQETDFPFEVVVHDDASSDGSADIIKEYAERYPDIICPILQDENQFSKGIQAIMRAVKPHIRGRYIAYLDCDDYWTDVHKLQKQADYLEAHPAFLAVAHNCTVVGADGTPIEEQYPECRDKEFTAEHFFNDILAGQLSTLMVRDIFTKSPEDHPLIVNAPAGPFDRAVNMTLLQNGRIHCIQNTMSAYRHVTDSGTSFSATFHYDIRRDARFYLSLVNYCKKMGRIGDAIGMLRWFTEYAKNYRYDSAESWQLAESLLSFCRKYMASLADRLMQNSEAPAQLAVYVQQPGNTDYTEGKSIYVSVALKRHYSCVVPLSDFGEITSLRIDPMQNPCVLRNISVHLVTESGEIVNVPIQQTNAASFQDALIFDNDDPQIELCIPRGTYESVSFSSKVVPCDPEGITCLREAAEQRDIINYQYGILQSTYQEVLESHCWKLTRPIRWFGDLLKGESRKPGPPALIPKDEKNRQNISTTPRGDQLAIDNIDELKD